MHIVRFLSFIKSQTYYTAPDTQELPLKRDPKSTLALEQVKPTGLKTCLRQSASSGALCGRLRQGPLTSRGGAMVLGLPRPVLSQYSEWGMRGWSVLGSVPLMGSGAFITLSSWLAD